MSVGYVRSRVVHNLAPVFVFRCRQPIIKDVEFFMAGALWSMAVCLLAQQVSGRTSCRHRPLRFEHISVAIKRTQSGAIFRLEGARAPASSAPVLQDCHVSSEGGRHQ